MYIKHRRFYLDKFLKYLIYNDIGCMFHSLVYDYSTLIYLQYKRIIYTGFCDNLNVNLYNNNIYHINYKMQFANDSAYTDLNLYGDIIDKQGDINTEIKMIKHKDIYKLAHDIINKL